MVIKNSTSQHTHTIKADGKPIVNELSVIEGKIAELRKTQDALTRNTKEWTATAKEINKLSAEADTVRGSMGTLSMTLGQLTKLQADLNKEFRQFGTGGDKLQEVNTRIAELRSETASTFKVVKESEGMWSSFGGWIKTAFSVGLLLEFGMFLKNVVSDGVTNFFEFEKAAASLKGETGMTTEALGKLKESAMATGNQFGMTGKDMLEGYNAIASGKSELLAVEGALQKVTEAAATLAIDGEMSMKDAANSVTESLNQFGKGADYATKFVNQLATGTIVGAGKVGEMSEALKKAGPIANAMGMSFAQTNAVLQLFHQNGIKGAEAGTQFKSMMAALLKGADDTNPSIVGLEKAFENLRKKNLSTTETMKLFGSEAVTGGLILTNNTATLKDWTNKIEKGAEGQAMFAAKTADASFMLKQKKAHLVDVGVAFANNLAPAIRLAIGAFGLLIDGLAGTAKLLIEIPKFIAENKALFAGLALAIISLNTANITAAASAIAHAAAERGRTIALGAATLAQRALNLAMNMNPIGIVITALSILVGVLVNAYNKSIEFRSIINGLWASLKVFAVAVKDLFVGLATFDARKIYSTISALGANMSKAYNASYEKETTAFRNAEEEKENQRKLKKLADAKLAAKQKADAEATAAALGNLKGHGTIEKQNKDHREKEAEKSLKAAKELAEKEAKLRKEGIDFIEKITFDSIKDKDEKARKTIEKQYKDEITEAEKLFSEKAIDFIQYSQLIVDIAKKRDASLKEQADIQKTEEKKALDDKAKAWQAALKQMDDALDDLDKEEDRKRKEREAKEKDHTQKLVERRKQATETIVGFINDSFNSTIATLESIDSAFAQSQANRIKAIQNGFNSVLTGLKDLKLPMEDIFAENVGKSLGDKIAGGLENAFKANPLAFIGAAKKIIDGINGVFEANRWAKFEAPLRKIIDDSLAAIEDMGKTLEIKMKALEAEGDKLLAVNDNNREQLTAAALDFEAEQLGVLVKSKEDLLDINEAYSADELRIKSLYADQLNSKDAETAAKARETVANLIHDLQVIRNEDIENLIHTENTKRDINRAADNELAELNRTAADRTLTEQQALIAAVEANRQADLAKLKDYEGQKAEINRLADEALLAAKQNANNLSIAEQERLITEIEAKRQLDLGNLATSELGIEAIKTKTAAELKVINENAAAETFRIEAELKAKQAQAEWQHNADVYAAQVQAFLAEKELTVAMLRLQLIKANGKIFNKSEAQAIEQALAAAYSAMPPMPPSGFFNPPAGFSDGGQSSEKKYEQGGFFEAHTGQTYANGGLAYGPSHSNGGIKLVDSQTGHVRGEMEGGEYIINKRATAANMALLSRINNSGIIGRVANSSFARKGQPAFEDGGVFSTFGPITLNQSNSMAAETVQILNNIAKATGATADASIKTASNTDATAKNTQASLQPLNEAANNSRNLGSIAQATRDTANKDFRPNISIINQQLGRLADIEASARL